MKPHPSTSNSSTMSTAEIKRHIDAMFGASSDADATEVPAAERPTGRGAPVVSRHA